MKIGLLKLRYSSDFIDTLILNLTLTNWTLEL